MDANQQKSAILNCVVESLDGEKETMSTPTDSLVETKSTPVDTAEESKLTHATEREIKSTPVYGEETKSSKQNI